MKEEKAVFALGCFWGVQSLFDKGPGVIRTTVGYTGGHAEHPTYHDVCTGNTGHAEAIELVYDAEHVTYAALLSFFWQHHNPTTLNRQGPDEGSQYRSAIFYRNPEQKRLAEESKETQQKTLARPIVTEIVPAGTFYPAEAYHQQYFAKKGIEPSCHI